MSQVSLWCSHSIVDVNNGYYASAMHKSKIPYFLLRSQMKSLKSIISWQTNLCMVSNLLIYR